MTVTDAVIQNINLTNGTDGKSVGVLIHLRDADGVPYALMCCTEWNNNYNLDELLMALCKFTINQTHINVHFMDGELAVENPAEKLSMYSFGNHWIQIS